MKKIFAFILCVLMLTSAFAGAAHAADIISDKTFELGDANTDSNVNAVDALMIKKLIAGYDTEAPDVNASDFDADGRITAKDAFCLKSVLAGVNSISSYENGKQIYKLTIAGRDIREFKITYPAGSKSEQNAYYAADTLRKYINISTGNNLTLVKGTTTGPAINFHTVDYYSEEGQELGLEGYKYFVKNGNLEVYGTFRGNMYAAFEIVEKYLGYRFFDGSEIFLYKSRLVDLPEGLDRFFYPKVATRNVRANFGNQDELALPLHINSTDHGGSYDYRTGLRTGSQFINAHSYGYYWRMSTGTMPDESFGNLSQRYQEKYNTGYQQDEYSWLPCLTSVDTFDVLYEGMLETMDMIHHGWGSYKFEKEFLDLGILSMSFSSCDNTNACSCRLCSSIAGGIRITFRNALERDTLMSLFKYGEINVVTEGKKIYGYTHKEGYSGLMMNHASLAAEKLQSVYPGMRVHSILYYHEIPETVRPSQWLNVWYCGTGCNNHWLGSHGCETADHGQLKYPKSDVYQSNIIDEPALIAWGQFCKETGAELWFWYYPVTYHYYLCGCPNILNIYYDYKYLYEECGVTNLFYEGGGQTYNFEKLKGYLAARMAYEPDMTLDEYIGWMKEYLYMEYGDGYEYIYEFIMMEEEAGDAIGHCFINNYDRPGDMYSFTYIAEHYEEMRALLVNALGMTNTSRYVKRINTLLECFDFLGLSAVYKNWYVNGTAEQKALYEQRYLTMLDYFNANNMVIFSDPNTYKLPSKPDFTVDPMTQFYEDGSRRPEGAWGN